jgi:putative transposase
MHFEKGNLYHIYNQGNNKQKIFFNKENYLFFLKKIRTYILPFADILAWCLMPNHIHIMVFVNEVEVLVTVDDTDGVTRSHPVSKKRTLNQSKAIMLRSYTRAIHKQNGSSGALFREATKAECLNEPKGITPSFYNTNSGTIIHIDNPEKQYPKICFNYIHQNPVIAHLVKEETDWEYSSAQEYAGLRNGSLINKEKAKEYFTI